MKNSIIFNSTDYSAIQACRQIIKKLLVNSDDYNISSSRFNTLIKAYNVLDSLGDKKITGYIDISANTHLLGGALDYSSFTISEDYLEIYTGYIKYDNGECDDSIWEKIYSSKDSVHKGNLSSALKCWAESFLLHLEENPARALCIIDKSNVEGDNDIYSEAKPVPKTGAPVYFYEPVHQEYEEVPF